MRTLALNYTANALLDGSGNGSFVAGPSFYGESWNVTSTGLSAASATNPAANIPQAKTFVGGMFLEGTYSGSLNSSDTVYTVHSGQQVVVTFVGGQPNDIITVTLLGTRVLP